MVDFRVLRLVIWLLRVFNADFVVGLVHVCAGLLFACVFAACAGITWDFTLGLFGIGLGAWWGWALLSGLGDFGFLLWFG